MAGPWCCEASNVSVWSSGGKHAGCPTTQWQRQMGDKGNVQLKHYCLFFLPLSLSLLSLQKSQPVRLIRLIEKRIRLDLSTEFTLRWSIRQMETSSLPSPPQDAFEVLAENYEFNELEGPCLAFRRAASVLKSLPAAVRRLEATNDLPCLGEHAKTIIDVRAWVVSY